MKNRKFTLLLRMLLTAALIAGMLAASGGTVSAERAGEDSSAIIHSEDSVGSIRLEGIRQRGRLYANAAPVSYNGSYRSEMEGDSIALMVYDALYEHSVTSPDNDTIELDVDPPYMKGDGSDYSATLAGFNESVRNGSMAFLYDHPEAFWVDLPGFGATAQADSGGKYRIIGTSVRQNEFFSGAFSQRAAVAAGVNNTVAAIEQGATRYDTVRNIHDYLCQHSTYDYEELQNGNKPQSHTIAPLFNGDGTYVCEGYAKSFKVLCDRFNIPCALVSGTGVTSGRSEGHMWNYVQMDDGKWYAVDVTWDDQSFGIVDNWFLKGSTVFAEDHSPAKPGGYDDSGNSFEFDLYYPPLAADNYDPDWNQGATSSDPGASEPGASEPGASEPSASEPGASEPSASEPSASEPSASEPSASEPSASEPSASEPSASEPSASEPSASEPSASEPSASEPSASEPSASEPSASEPSASEPSASEPDSSEPAAPAMIALTLDNPNNGFVKSAQIPETAKAKAGNDDVALDKIRIIVTKLDDTKKKTLSDGIRKINNSYDPDNSMLEAYDIELVDGNNNTVTIIEGKVKICLAFPSDSSNNYTNYVYSVYHQKNDGSVERITPVGYNAQGVWFENDKFSPHGLVSVKKSGGDEPSPGTGETILMTVVAIILLALAACAIAFVVIRNKKSDNHDELPETDDTQSRD